MKQSNILCSPRLLAIALTFSCFTAHAAVPGYGTDTCPPMPAGQVSVTNFFEPPAYNFQHTMSSLKDISERQASNVLKKEQPVGLAIGELTMGLTLQSDMVIGTDGQVCARPKLLRLDAGFQHNTVYVASELPRRSCAHEEVLDHEEHHVAIDRQLLQEYKPILTKFAERAVEQLGVIRASSPDEAERQMQMFLNTQLQAASDTIREERTRRQLAHDSTEEYERLGKVCDGAIASAVRQYGNKEQTASQSSQGVNAARLPPPVRSPARQPFTRY